MTRPLTDALLRDELALPCAPEGGKETRGSILVVGGCTDMPGASVLAGLGALRAGAGRLVVAAPASVQRHIAAALLEARVRRLADAEEPGPDDAEALIAMADEADAVVIGPGTMDHEGSGRLAAAVIAAPGDAPLLIDAAAMTGLVPHMEAVRRRGRRLVLTPHAGELARLLHCEREAVEADLEGAGRRAARAFDAVVVAKGATTFIVSPDGQSLVHEGGAPGLGACGSGDVLAGIVGGLLARGAASVAAAAWGVRLHALAGERLSLEVGPFGFMAREIPPAIPRLMAELHGV